MNYRNKTNSNAFSTVFLFLSIFLLTVTFSPFYFYLVNLFLPRCPVPIDIGSLKGYPPTFLSFSLLLIFSLPIIIGTLLSLLSFYFCLFPFIFSLSFFLLTANYILLLHIFLLFTLSHSLIFSSSLNPLSPFLIVSPPSAVKLHTATLVFYLSIFFLSCFFF